MIKLYRLKRQIIGCLARLLSHLDLSIPGYSFEISLIKTFAIEIIKVMNWQICHALQKSPQICNRMSCTCVLVMLYICDFILKFSKSAVLFLITLLNEYKCRDSLKRRIYETILSTSFFFFLVSIWFCSFCL